MGRLIVAAALCLALTGCKTDLYSGLGEREANEIVAVLQLAGIDADRKMVAAGEVTVMVPKAHFAAAVETLNAEGYPRQTFQNLGDVFEGNGFVVSQMEERARFIFALSEELSRTISEIDGVLSARVHVVLPTEDPLSRRSEPSSASVVIRHAADAATRELQPEIKVMVANSIEGLDYDSVSVVFIPVIARDLPRPDPVTPLPDLPMGLLVGAAGGALALILGLVGALVVMIRRKARPQAPAFSVEPAE
ncbi:MAG: type III secretion inner membrane ring lipoprotein SctJ [Pseudomonadota bacterium]